MDNTSRASETMHIWPFSRRGARQISHKVFVGEVAAILARMNLLAHAFNRVSEGGVIIFGRAQQMKRQTLR